MTQRQNLHFPPKEAALRDDVHALGSLVGDVLKDQGGAELYDPVEGDRLAAIRWREGEPEGAIELVVRTSDRPAGQARDLIRAFTTWFEVVNLAERVHRVRRRREYLLTRDKPQPGGIGDCMYRLKAAGLSGEQVLGLLASITIQPVFIAHPTESTRRTVLRKQQQLADLMNERLDPMLPPAERRAIWERIRAEVTSGWQTEDHPRERLTVADEREHVLFYLAEVLYRVAPSLHEEIAIWLETVFDMPRESQQIPALLKLGTWVGGDMDGNPDVHAKTIRESLQRQHQRIISNYYDECRGLSDKLTQSASRVGISRELSQRIAEYDILMPQVRHATPTRHDEMPYRLFLAQVAARLRITYDGLPNHYESADHFTRDIEIVAASLRENHGQHAGLFPVERLLCRARIFGFHLATLDVRQHAAVHHDVVAEGLGDGEWLKRTAEERMVILRETLERDRGPSAPLGAVGRRTLAVFEAMAQGRSRYGDAAVGDYIIGATEAPEDVLAVMLLARWSDITDRQSNEVPLDLVPLVESADALARAGEILSGLLAEETYQQHLAARGRHQVILVGYSDSNKELGIVASRLAVHRAQSMLMLAAAQASVSLTLFHGRGGTAIRGGGPIDQLIESAPAGSVHGKLRVTEQGEVIANSYGLQRIALRTLEQAVFSTMQDRVHAKAGAAVDRRHLELTSRVAEASAAHYQALVKGREGFERYFREVTPIDVIERMQIGNRPASRAGQGIDALRTIPWVFAWTQSRHTLPGWYGVGTGLDAAAAEFGPTHLAKAWAEWPFFRNLIDDIEMQLVRADLEIASHYDDLAEGSVERIIDDIRTEHARSCRWVTWIKGEVDLLDSHPRMQRSVMLRAPYLDPIHLMQVDLLKRWREGKREDRELFRALVASVTGIAQGLQATG